MAVEYKRRPFTVDEYHRLAEIGVLSPEERVELIDGELVEMAPIGNRHWGRHASIVKYLIEKIGAHALIVPQGSFPLDSHSEPQPDIAILALRSYEERGVDSLDEIYAFVEVSDTSLAFDLGRKQRLYASRSIRDSLVVDIARDRLICFSDPGEFGYGEQRELRNGDTFTLAALSDIVLNVDPFLAPRT